MSVSVSVLGSALGVAAILCPVSVCVSYYAVAATVPLFLSSLASLTCCAISFRFSHLAFWNLFSALAMRVSQSISRTYHKTRQDNTRDARHIHCTAPST